MTTVSRAATVGLALCICVLGAGTTRAQSARPAAEQEIAPLLDSMMAAANAHDTDRFLAHYARESTLVFVFDGVVIHGWDALHAQQLKWWNSGHSDVVYSRRGAPEFLVLSPTIAVVMSPLASRRVLPSGQTQTGQFAETAVWQRRPEGWRIVEAHESTVR